MNIFAIDDRPKKAAMHVNNQHAVKMPLESAQLLSTTRRYFGDKNPRLYKSTHVNHPSNVWVRESLANYIWLCHHFKALCEVS
jgi:hypothetical protein